MKDIIQSISHFQGEFVYNLNHHREKHNLGKAMKTLNLSTYLTSCGATKTRGYHMVHLFFAMLLLPFLKRSFSALWQHFFFLEHLRAKKDTYYIKESSGGSLSIVSPSRPSNRHSLYH